MTSSPLKKEDHNDIEMLLPWYATGALSDNDMVRVERALQHDPQLRHRLELVREEQLETTIANERLGVPGADLGRRMMEMIDAEPAPRRSVGQKIRATLARFDGMFSGLAPQTIRMGAAIAAIVIVAQGIFIGTAMLREPPARFTTASGESAGTTAAGGTYALVKFNSSAASGDIARMLSDMNIVIVDGPKPGGFFKVRLSSKRLTDMARKQTMINLQKRTKLVEMVLPAN